MVVQSRALSLAAAAESYLRRGWSFIPLLGKQPGVATWKNYQSCLPTSGEIARWFLAEHARATGIGIITGKLSGLVVVDCDTPEDAAYWAERFPQSSLTVETGRGGVHVYYAASADGVIHNRVKLFRRQIDIRGEGGYVAAPPSRHPNGSYYAWTATRLDQRQALPKFELSWLVDSHSELSLSDATVSMTEVRNVVSYIRRIHAIAGQGGHNATFRAACKLRDAGLAPQKSLAILVKWNETNANPPWSHAELIHKIESAYQVGG
jgi:hypothetical protein